MYYVFLVFKYKGQLKRNENQMSQKLHGIIMGKKRSYNVNK
jgi:hypothetical protein